MQRGASRVEQLLAQARAEIFRLEPVEARRAMLDGTLLIDIRADRQRARDGVIPGARFVSRNVLEWRLDPTCDHRDPELARPGARLLMICNEGYQSSLAAATLAGFGLEAGDLVGGFQAWRRAGLPVEPDA